MNPGKLDKRVIIERVNELEDDEGSFYDNWTEYCKRWANVRPVGGREPYINDQRLAELDLVVTLRYDSKTATITEKDRVNYKGRKLEINAMVNVQEEDEELRLFCTETRDGNRY